MEQMYKIWSREHNGWWKQNKNGYTPDALEAGTFSQREAFEIVANANRFTRRFDAPEETLVPV